MDARRNSVILNAGMANYVYGLSANIAGCCCCFCYCYIYINSIVVNNFCNCNWLIKQRVLRLPKKHYKMAEELKF